MGNHTPGPWSLDKYGNVVDQAGIQICVTGLFLVSGYLPSESAPFANRDLIAAAPEMLEVLIDLSESAQYWSEYDVPIGIIDRLNAVISKAKGE